MTDTEWQQLAACRNVDPETLYPVGRQGAREAEQVERQAAHDICIGMGCTVRAECLVDALRHGPTNQHGVSGGKTAAQRIAILRKQQRATDTRKVSA